MIVNVFVGPGQDTLPLVKVGVTTIVATTEVVPALTAVKEAILPEPFAARPMEGVSLVHA